MDQDRFDNFARALGSGRSRRSLLKGLGAAALGAVGLDRLGSAEAAGSNSACAHFCNQVFGANTAAASQCASQAAHGSGPCSQCGPAAPAGNGQQLCGTHCIPTCPPPADACHGQGACDPATGACRPNPLLAGFCFIGGVCVAQGAANPANQCQICDPTQTTAAFSNRPNGTACDDGNACTQTDACQNGVCVGSNPVVCTASDQCHDAGTCDPKTGVCSNPNKANGTPCNDGNACTLGDACQSGLCQGGAAVVCMALDQCHVAGRCDPTTGTCSNPNAPDNTPCDDGNACTTNDACQGGTCVGGPPPVCDSGNRCLTDSCDPTLGCVTTPKPAGTACDDATLCNGHEICDGAGTCLPGKPVVCVASDQCHDIGTCDPVTGQCSNPPLPDGTSCEDGNLCTIGDTCQAGSCAPGTATTCVASDQCHVAGTCDPATGQCSNPPATDGTACNDGNACTRTDACQGGTCVGGNPVVCQPLDQCHDAGVCDPTTGVCSNPDKSNGASCNDGDACTQTDACQSGVCTGANPVVCAPSDACHVAGTCDPTTGQCSNPAAPDGAPCAESTCANDEVTIYACAGGACAPTTRPCPGNLACYPTGIDCYPECYADEYCASGFYCANNTCQPKQGNGLPCSEGGQCASGNCVGGHCCAAASCGACESCASGSCAYACGAGQFCDNGQYCCDSVTYNCVLVH